MPESAVGLVVLSNLQPQLAALVRQRGLATLELDLDGALDVEVTATKLIAAIDAITRDRIHRGLPIGLLCVCDNAPAAMIAAAQRIDLVSAIACVGGRPERAGVWLQVLRTPTLLIAPSRDTAMLRANREVARRLVAAHHVTTIPGVARLFDDPGALAEVAAAVAAWFVAHATRDPAHAMQSVIA